MVKATTKKPTPAQTEQSAPATSKTADELLAAVMAIETELAAIPQRISQAKEAALNEVDSEKIAAAFAVVAELESQERILRVQHWHTRKAYLTVAREEALNPAPNLQNETVKAREELSQAEKVAKAAIATRDAAERRFKNLAGQLRAAAIQAQQLAGELQQHEQRRPEV